MKKLKKNAQGVDLEKKLKILANQKLKEGEADLKKFNLKTKQVLMNFKK